MNNKHQIPNLDLLDQIQKVDAPPFLLTRIQQKIDNKYLNKLSPRMALGLSVSFILIIVLNIAVVVNYNKNSIKESNLAQSMNLMPDNYLYR
ncbi:MAG: hypothetical protein V4677_07685 [Bacteroidota bacterium]